MIIKSLSIIALSLLFVGCQQEPFDPAKNYNEKMAKEKELEKNKQEMIKTENQNIECMKQCDNEYNKNNNYTKTINSIEMSDMYVSNNLSIDHSINTMTGSLITFYFTDEYRIRNVLFSFTSKNEIDKIIKLLEKSLNDLNQIPYNAKIEYEYISNKKTITFRTSNDKNGKMIGIIALDNPSYVFFYMNEAKTRELLNICINLKSQMSEGHNGCMQNCASKNNI